MGWILVCLLMPYLGPLIYVLFGINRIGQSAQRAGQFPPSAYPHSDKATEPSPVADTSAERFVRISDQVAHRPMVGGNLLDSYATGEAAHTPEIG